MRSPSLAAELEVQVRDSRHKTAMKRNSLSRPVSAALRDELLAGSRTFFDFGCGHGTDIQILKSSGVLASGWDPYYKPGEEKKEASIVNLGFVLNVIEDPAERKSVLEEAFRLSQDCLIVSVRIDGAFFETRFGDGAITKDGSFQKIYSQSEFRTYVEDTLKRRLHFVEPGIGYIFKSESLEREYRSKKYVNRLAFREKGLLKKIELAVEPEKFVRLIEDLGRVPDQREIKEFSFLGKRKFKEFVETTVMPLVDKAKYEASRRRVEEDLLHAVAVSRIENRAFPSTKELSQDLLILIDDIFGDYKTACKYAESLLMRLGNSAEVAKTGRQSVVGKLLPEDLYVHVSALDQIPGLMKLMLSLGESLVGRVKCDLVKFSLHGKSLSFLFYRDFDVEAHPQLEGSIRIDFRTAKHQVRDYSTSENPPILHRKDSFVLPSYEHYQTFKALTNQEESANLLGGSNIGFKLQWEEFLKKNGYMLSGHNLIQQPIDSSS